MTSKFLSNVGSNVNLSNGSADINVNSISIAGITQIGKPLTLSSSKHIEASDISTGGVEGPATSVNNTIPIFIGTTGKILGSSNVTISSDVLATSAGFNGPLYDTIQRLFKSNSTYISNIINTGQLPITGIVPYGCQASSSCIQYIADTGGNEASGWGSDHLTDNFTIFTPGDTGSHCNFQDEDSSESRIAYVNTSGVLTQVSSRKRKNRIRDKKNNNVLERFKQLKIKSYGYNQPETKDDMSERKKKRLDKKRERMHMGIILEELFEIFPNCCDGYYNKLGRSERKTNLNIEEEIPKPEDAGIDYTKVQLYHIMAFQDYIRNTDAKIKELEDKLNSLVN